MSLSYNFEIEESHVFLPLGQGANLERGKDVSKGGFLFGPFLAK